MQRTSKSEAPKAPGKQPVQVRNCVSSTGSEVEAKRSDEGFFLATVSGLEDGAGQLPVRLIFDPLTNLAV